MKKMISFFPTAKDERRLALPSNAADGEQMRKRGTARSPWPGAAMAVNAALKSASGQRSGGVGQRYHRALTRAKPINAERLGERGPTQIHPLRIVEPRHAVTLPRDGDETRQPHPFVLHPGSVHF